MTKEFSREPHIELENVWKTFDGGFAAVRDLSLAVYRGETLVLIGPSGCGKSTFIRCLNRMHDMTPGFRMTGGSKPPFEGSRRPAG